MSSSSTSTSGSQGSTKKETNLVGSIDVNCGNKDTVPREAIPREATLNVYIAELDIDVSN